MDFNKSPAQVMHIDFNSCFASIEQQANPLLRGKPVVVAAYASAKGCILAASREAKAMGKIKTGMQVVEAKKLIPNLIVLEPDSMKYRSAHHALHNLLLEYTPKVEPKSIDEFVCHFQNFKSPPNLKNISLEIKQRIKDEIGDWLTVSIGLGPNRFLAKQAAIFKKPDGLEEINHTNYLDYYSKMKLTDLNGISFANENRLNWVGIYSVLDLYKADVATLKRGFGGIVGYYWYLRLRGQEIDDVQHDRSMFGSMYSLSHPAKTLAEASSILTKLVEKAGVRMQKDSYSARSLSLWLRLNNKTYFHETVTSKEPLFSTLQIIKQANFILKKYNFKYPVTKISFSLSNLQQTKSIQFSLLENTQKSYDLSQAVYKIKDKWGQYGLTLANMVNTKQYYKDFIGFGNIKDINHLVEKQSFSSQPVLEELSEEAW